MGEVEKKIKRGSTRTNSYNGPGPDVSDYILMYEPMNLSVFLPSNIRTTRGHNIFDFANIDFDYTFTSLLKKYSTCTRDKTLIIANNNSFEGHLHVLSIVAGLRGINISLIMGYSTQILCTDLKTLIDIYSITDTIPKRREAMTFDRIGFLLSKWIVNACFTLDLPGPIHLNPELNTFPPSMRSIYFFGVIPNSLEVRGKVKLPENNKQVLGWDITDSNYVSYIVSSDLLLLARANLAYCLKYDLEIQNVWSEGYVQDPITIKRSLIMAWGKGYSNCVRLISMHAIGLLLPDSNDVYTIPDGIKDVLIKMVSSEPEAANFDFL